MRISGMNWSAVEAYLGRDDRAVLPLGSTEQHGITPYFLDYPGSISLRVDTYIRIVRDVLDGMARQGFKRILLCNGHGGNAPAGSVAIEWMADNPGVQVKFHNWWNAPKTYAKVQEIDSVASHASWMENFAWTRLAGVAQPTQRKPMVDLAYMRVLDPAGVRKLLGDGNFGGYYERSDDEMQAIWDIAVLETRALLEEGWA